MTLNERIADACAEEAMELARMGNKTLHSAIKLLDQAADALRNSSPVERATWQYHNDEHGVWWGCSNCGKIIHRPPNDKLYCSNCGAKMREQA